MFKILSIFKPDVEVAINEMIVDYFGLSTAYKAFKNHQNKTFEAEKKLPRFESFTQDQLFFIAFGLQLCESYSDYGVKKLEKNLHLYAKFRSHAALQNRHFEEAFNCPKE